MVLTTVCAFCRVQTAFLVMNHVGGKLLLFQGGSPSLGPGRLKNREPANMALYNTDKEPQLRNPEDPFFKRFAAECSRVQITLDVVLGSAQYADLASLASIPRYTCGQVRQRHACVADRLYCEVLRCCQLVCC